MTELKLRKSVEEQIEEEMDQDDHSLVPELIEIDKGVVSSGSTLLDLCISGTRIKGGGMPGGILVEIAGEAGLGKTALLEELCRTVQKQGGQVRFLDPEARLDQQYAKIYGINISSDKFDYHRPDTVSGMFDLIWDWKPVNPKVINLIASDSLAALSTDLELSEKGDKMGMRRGKEFSEGLRKTCRMIEKNGWIIACSNQLREGEKGVFTPGGKGVPYYASLRIWLTMPKKKGMKHQIDKTKKIMLDEETEVNHTKIIGINSWATIIKSSVDDPFRNCHIPIMFKHGVDDIRANLQYLKDMFKYSTYNAITKKFQSLDDAVQHIEDNDLEEELKGQVIDVWNTLEGAFEVKRKPK